MQTLIVDTDVVSYGFKKDSRAVLYEPHLKGSLPAISFMTLAELERWTIARNWGRRRRQQLEEYLTRYVTILPDHDLCRAWAEVSEQVRRMGHQIETADAWIAATALFYRVPLVTHNRQHYVHVQGLILISEAPK